MQSKSLFLLLVSFMFLSSCNDKTNLLVGTWRVNNLKYTRDIPAEMQPAIDNSISQLRQSFALTYRNDGTYATQMGEQSLSGKWKLNWNSSKIVATSSAGDAKTFEVMELSADKLTFKANEGGEDVIFEMVKSK